MGNPPVLWEEPHPCLLGCREATSARTCFWSLSSFCVSCTTPLLGRRGTGGLGFAHRNAVLDWEPLGGSGEAEGAAKPPSLAFPVPAVGWSRAGSALGTGGRREQTASAPEFQSPKGIAASQLQLQPPAQPFPPQLTLPAWAQEHREGSWKNQDLPHCLRKALAAGEVTGHPWKNPPGRDGQTLNRSSPGGALCVPPSREFCREGKFCPLLSVVSKLQEEMWELAQPPGRTQAWVNHWISPHLCPAPHWFPVPARAAFNKICGSCSDPNLDLALLGGSGALCSWVSNKSGAQKPSNSC